MQLRNYLYKVEKIMRLALEGKQNKEISEILGIAVTTVKTPEIQRTENVEKFPERLFPRVVVYFIPEKIKKMIPIHPFTIFVCS